MSPLDKQLLNNRKKPEDEFASWTPSILTNAQADLVILTADPLEDITNTSLIDGVIFQGKYLEESLMNF